MVRGDSIDIHCSLEKCTEALRIGRLAERSLFINIMFRLLKEDALILFFPPSHASTGIRETGGRIRQRGKDSK